MGDYLVTVIEFTTFSYFLHASIRSQDFKQTIKITGLFVLISFTAFFYSNLCHYQFVQGDLSNTYILKSSVLLVFCSFYFIELFTLPPIYQLLRSPGFWVSSGLMFYLIGSFPFALIAKYMLAMNYPLYTNFFTIVYTLYIILFMFIMRAYMLTGPYKPGQ